MKRLFTFFATILVAVATIAPVSAQERGEWSIRGGVGWFSLPDFVGALVVGLGSIDGTEGTTSHDFVPMLNPNVELLYGCNNWLSVGGTLSVGYASATSKFDDTGAVNKQAWALYPSLGVAAKTRYFQSGKFSMYGSWSLGVIVLMSEQSGAEITERGVNTAAVVMGNAYPLCFSYGGDTGGFLEAGWGFKGIVNLGVYHNF